MNFCQLKKDEKTYNILCLYLDDFKQNQDVLKEDNKLQCQEIVQHNQLNCKDESNEWIKQNGKKYRNYLNAIKILATIFYCSRTELTWENFEYMIDRYNHCEPVFLEKIHIEISEISKNI